MLSQIRTLRQRLYRGWFSASAAGADVLCLVCGWHGKRWLQNTCPRCNSMPRHRLMPFAVGHFRVNLANGGLLHVGANIEEVAWIERKFSPRPYHRLDLIDRPTTNLRGNLCELSLPCESVQHALLWHVLEHIPDDRSAIAQLFRVLKPGGSVIASVPIEPKGREKTYEDASIPREQFEAVHGHYDHVRSCGLDYAERFIAAGFEVETLTIGEETAERKFYGLSVGHVVWCCRKPQR